MNVVLVLSYNHSEITKRALRSVYACFDGPVYLVHNGSLSKNIAALKKDFPKAAHLELTENKGYSGGLNFGLESCFKSGASQCFFLSNDVVISKLKFPKPGKEYGLIAPKVFLRETGRVHSVGGELNLYKGELRHLTTAFYSKHKLYVPGSAFFIHRAAFLATKGFDEKLGSYWEDVDLSLRLTQLNFELAHSDSTLVKHGVAKTTGGDPLYTVYYFHRNRRIVTWRHGTLATRMAFLPLYLASSMRKLFNYSRIGDFPRLKLCLKALLW